MFDKNFKRNRIIFYSIIIVFFSVSLSYYTFKYWEVPSIELQSSAMQTIKNFSSGKGYFGNISDYDFNFYIHRYPVQVLIPSALIYLSPDNLGIVYLIKNILFLSLFLFSLSRVIKKHFNISVFSLITLTAILINPFFISVFANLSTEESFSITIFSILFSYLFFKENVIKFYHLLTFFILILIIVSLKSSYIFISFLLPIMFFVRYDNKKVLTTGLSAVLIGALAIGSWSAMKTGSFKIGSSYDWFNFYKGNNILTDSYYIGDLDKLPNQYLEGSFKNEWEWSDKYKELSIEFINENPFKFVKLVFKKMYVFFIDFFPVNKSSSVSKYIFYAVSILLTKIIFYIHFIGFFKTSFESQQNRSSKALFVVLSIFIFFYSAPYLLGFAYIRHFMPLAIVAFYLSVLNDEREFSVNKI
jgi:hypothetical protein